MSTTPSSPTPRWGYAGILYQKQNLRAYTYHHYSACPFIEDSDHTIHLYRFTQVSFTFFVTNSVLFFQQRPTLTQWPCTKCAINLEGCVLSSTMRTSVQLDREGMINCITGRDHLLTFVSCIVMILCRVIWNNYLLKFCSKCHILLYKKLKTRCK